MIKLRHKLSKVEISVFITNFIRILLIIAVVREFYIGQYMNCFTALISLFLTFLPSIVARQFGIYLPTGLQLIIIIFVFAAMFCGEIQRFYDIFWWWDKMLHTISGLILGFVGFSITYTLNKEEKVNLKMSPIYICIFSFAFAVCMGALWEIFEFSLDQLFGFNCQRAIETGVVDTMQDIIVDTIGAIISSILGYYYIFVEKKKVHSLTEKFDDDKDK